MSVATSSQRVPWLRLGLVAAALAAGVGVGVAVAIAQGSGGSSPETRSRSSSRNAQRAAPDPGIAFPAGTRRAPDFTLRDQAGRPISLHSLRGRPVIVSFIDPVCRNLCPLEAKVLDAVPAQLPASIRPVIVAVSVNPWNQTQTDLKLDAQKWQLVPEWRWALGGYAALARVWSRYSIGVAVQTKTLAGVTVRNITHTEAAYVIDPRGYERALFVYPYRAADVVAAVRRVSAS